MRLFTITLFFLCFQLMSFGQTLKGKVYDSKSVVEDIKVWNKTQNRLTITDENGDFSIEANVNDTIAFQSVFYYPKTIIIKQSHFEDINVFEIEKVTNELDEVEIQAEKEQPVFEEETYNEELQNLIKEDIKNNPHLYQPEGSQYGANIFAIIGLAIKLFKKKDKYKAPEYEPISYKQLNSLFSTSTFFNKTLVTQSLNIPEDKIKLFYDFCSAKGISSELLQENKKMRLLEELVTSSQLFLNILEEYDEETINKD